MVARHAVHDAGPAGEAHRRRAALPAASARPLAVRSIERRSARGDRHPEGLAAGRRETPVVRAGRGRLRPSRCRPSGRDGCRGCGRLAAGSPAGQRADPGLELPGEDGVALPSTSRYMYRPAVEPPVDGRCRRGSFWPSSPACSPIAAAVLRAAGRLAVVPRHAGSRQRSRSGRQAADGGPVHVSPHDRRADRHALVPAESVAAEDAGPGRGRMRGPRSARGEVLGAVGIWRNTDTLFGHTLEMDPTNDSAHYILGSRALAQGTPRA